MSVQRDEHRNTWRVRWRENGQQRSQSFTRKKDAERHDREVKRRLEIGPHLLRELDRTPITVRQFLADGFQARADRMQPDTRRSYAWALDNHLAELLDEPLAAIDGPRLIDHQDHLAANGRTPNTIRQAMAKMSGILQTAVEKGLITHNPARGLSRIKLDPRSPVQPLQPVQLEALIAQLDGRSRATAVLCGYLGMRPKEARLALWSDFQGPTLVIDPTRTKRGAARPRAITVPAAGQRELRAWQLESGGRGDQPIIGLSQSGLLSWANTILAGAATTIDRPDLTLYTLRHTHASLLHYCGWTVPDAAERMGHSGTVHLDTYAHSMKTIGPRRWPDLDSLITEAREEQMCPHSAPNAKKG